MIEPYYDQDGITIYYADCLDVLPQLDAVDHVITDPPYSDAVHDGARTNAVASGVVGGRLLSGGAEREFAPVTEDVIRAVLGMASPSQWTVATMAREHAFALEVTPPAGMRFVRFGVWVKPDGMPQMSGDRPAQGWEAIAILHREGGRMNWNGGGARAVWIENVARGNHPTEKPIRLLHSIVGLFTSPGETILDPFMGSGTTLRAAKDLGRRAIGIEINKDYCDIAIERLRQGVLL